MTNPYYNHGSYPATRGSGSSQQMRAELDAVTAGFGLLPSFTGNALKVWRNNAGGTGVEAVDAATLLSGGPLSGITDLTTTGNTILGNAVGDTLNVAGGSIQVNGAGSVGINVAPLAKFHVKTTGEIARFETTTARGGGQDYISFWDPTGRKGYIGWGGAADEILYINNEQAAAVRIYTNAAMRVEVDSSGQVGIGGSATAGYKLDVVGKSTIRVGAGADAYTEYAGNNNTPGSSSFAVGQNAANDAVLINRAGAGNLIFGAGSTELFRCTTSGHLEPISDGTQNIGVSRHWNIVSALQLQRTSAGALTISSSNGSGSIDLRTGGVSRAQISAALGFKVLDAFTANSTALFNNGLTVASGTISGDITPALVNGFAVGYRGLPTSSQVSGALTSECVGKKVKATAGVTINSGVFSDGDTFVVRNTTGGNITITQGAGTTLELPGSASTGSRTLAQKGMATITCNGSENFSVSGAGVS